MAKTLRREQIGKSNVRVIECNRCGAEVMCIGFTNTCDCGRDYNMSGQELANRSQWGEETGETASDIVNAEAEGFPEDDDCF